MSEIEKLYTDAIDDCDVWRSKTELSKATPNEIHLYNIFTDAKNKLQDQLACIKDIQGNYNHREAIDD